MKDQSLETALENLKLSHAHLEKEIFRNKVELAHLSKKVRERKDYDVHPKETISELQPMAAPTKPATKQLKSEAFSQAPKNKLQSESSETKNPPSTRPPIPATPKQQKKKATVLPIENTMEKYLATVWFVRIGIITLLTGLVFLSNYAYTNFIYELSPWPRLTGLYLLISLFIRIGYKLQKSKENLRNYGSVLSAGGLAILYYTNYAAYHVERLKVISSPLLAGIILTLTALICLQYALSKKSNTIAVVSLSLAFYSTSIAPAGTFTLISSTLLAGIGLLLFYRLKFVSIGITTLLGAYVSYAYWQIFVNTGELYAHAHYLLIPYWILFTSALFLCKPMKNLKVSIPFITLNNTFFYILFSVLFSSPLSLSPVSGFTAIFGTLLIAISLFLTKSKTHCIVLSFVYFSKGLALITYALCLWLSGPSLAISLAIQTALLLILFIKRENPATGVGAVFTFCLSFVILFSTQSTNPFLYCCMVLLYFAHTIILSKATLASIKKSYIITQTPLLLAVITTIAGIIHLTYSTFDKAHILLVFALLYHLPMFTIWLRTKFPSLPYCANLLTITAIYFWMKHYTPGILASFYLISSILLVGIFTLYFIFENRAKNYIHVIYLTIAHISLVLFFINISEWVSPIITLSLIPIIYHLLFQCLKCRSFATLGLLTYPIAWLGYLGSLIFIKTIHDATSLSIAIPLIHYALQRLGCLKMIRYTNGYFIISSTLLSVLWAFITFSYPPIFLVLLGLLYILLEEKNRYHVLTYTGLTLIGFSYTCHSFSHHSLTLSFIVISLTALGYIKFRMDHDQKHQSVLQNLLASFLSLTLAISTTRMVHQLFGEASYSVAWALLGFALLVIGMLSKESVFRIAGVIILGVCVINVYFFDVWKLHALLRIFSFITLGGVLILTGYLYCRTISQKKDGTAHKP